MTEEEVKRCIRCRVEQDIENFRIKKGKNGGRNATCNSCLDYHRKFTQSKNLQPVNFVSVSESNKYAKQRLLGVVLKNFMNEVENELQPFACATHNIKSCPKCLSSTICKHMGDILKVCRTTKSIK